jgi:hypothetical protein
LQGLLLTPEQQETRRQRNLAIGIASGCFVLLFYAATIARLGPGVLNRPLDRAMSRLGSPPTPMYRAERLIAAAAGAASWPCPVLY